MKKIILLTLVSFCFITFSFGQQLESITPNSTLLGSCSSNLEIEISATGTNFTQASWLEMWFETNNGSDTYANLNALNDELASGFVSMENFSTCGDFDVVVYTANEGTLTLPNAFNIPCPELDYITPNEANLGEFLTVEIGMNNVNFSSGSQMTQIWLSQGSNVVNLGYDVQSENYVLADAVVPTDIECGNYNLTFGCAGIFGSSSLFEVTDAFEITCDATLGGNVYFDENGNGIQDGNEGGMENATVIIQPGDIQVSTDEAGNYNLPLGEGTYQITVQAPTYYEQSSLPTMYEVTILEGENTLDNNFGLSAPQPITDVEVVLTGSTPISGFTSNYWITYKNLGTTTVNGTISLELDPAMFFDYSEVPPTTNTLNTLTWDYTDLAPFEERTINFYCTIDVLPPGNFLSSVAEITPFDNDVDQTNNESVINEEILTSYDPNDKAVTPAGVQDEHYTLIADAELEYKIRFQNTGTYPAQNVIIEDTLSSFLDPATFHLVAASHAVEYAIRGNAVEFIFSNIQLPDSTANEPESHGFVKFSIRPFADISDNTVINNTAFIYFDFNPAVETNTVTNTMVNVIPVSTTNPSLNKAAVKVYPNPAQDFAVFEVLDASYKDNLRFKLYDALGRIVQDKNVDPTFTVSREAFNSGVYFYQIASNGETINTGRLVFD